MELMISANERLNCMTVHYNKLNDDWIYIWMAATENYFKRQ